MITRPETSRNEWKLTERGASKGEKKSPVFRPRYGRGKALKRCLKIEGGLLTWGSKKGDTPAGAAATKAVLVSEIREVINASFDDAPPDVDEACMLCFNISNRAGLKIIANSQADAVVLLHGFGLYCEQIKIDKLNKLR